MPKVGWPPFDPEVARRPGYALFRPRQNHPEPAGNSGELDEVIVTFHDIEPGSSQLSVDNVRLDVMLRDLLIARQPSTRIVQWFHDQQASARLESGTNVPKHRIVLGHFVVSVVDQRRVELTDGEMRIVGRAENRIDVRGVLT